MSTVQLPDIETVAELVHDAWRQAKLLQGITSRLSETGEELMRPYAELSEAAKNLDRIAVFTVYEAIRTVRARSG